MSKEKIELVTQVPTKRQHKRQSLKQNDLVESISTGFEHCGDENRSQLNHLQQRSITKYVMFCMLYATGWSSAIDRRPMVER